MAKSVVIRKRRNTAIFISGLCVFIFALITGKYLISLTMKETQRNLAIYDVSIKSAMQGKHIKNFEIFEYNLVYSANGEIFSSSFRTPYKYAGTSIKVNYWSFYPKIYIIDADNPGIVPIIFLLSSIVALCCLVSSSKSSS